MTSSGYLAGLKSDGTVYTALADAYRDYGPGNQLDWTDIVRIYGSRASDYLIGRKSDGSFRVAVGDNGDPWISGGDECVNEDMLNSAWKNLDIVDLVCTGEGITEEGVVALLSDGTVSGAGRVPEGILKWKNIVSMDCHRYYGLCGVTQDGRVLFAEEDLPSWMEPAKQWTDIQSVTLGSSCLLGLKKDGSVVVAADDEALDDTDSIARYSDPRAAGNWTDMAAVYDSDMYVYGITKNGDILKTDLGGGYEQSSFPPLEYPIFTSQTSAAQAVGQGVKRLASVSG